MTKRTKEEVEKFFNEDVPHDRHGDFEVRVYPWLEGWRVEVDQMYNYAPFNFAFLKKVAEFFGTENLNESRWSRDGCETCDYGSVYTVELTIQP